MALLFSRYEPETFVRAVAAATDNEELVPQERDGAQRGLFTPGEGDAAPPPEHVPGAEKILKKAFFMRRLFHCLRNREPGALALAAKAIREALEFGPEPVLRFATPSSRPFYLAARAVGKEYRRMQGFIRLVPMPMDDEEWLCGKARPSHDVLDLAAAFLHKRMRSPVLLVDLAGRDGFLCRSDGGEVESLSIENDFMLTLNKATEEDELIRAFREYYRAHNIPTRHNPKLAGHRMPLRYRDWVLEGGWLDEDIRRARHKSS